MKEKSNKREFKRLCKIIPSMSNLTPEQQQELFDLCTDLFHLGELEVELTMTDTSIYLSQERWNKRNKAINDTIDKIAPNLSTIDRTTLQKYMEDYFFDGFDNDII